MTARFVERLARAVGPLGIAVLLVGNPACTANKAPQASEGNVAAVKASLTPTSWPVESLVASNSISLGSSAQVNGAVAVVAAATGAVLGASGIELTLGTGARITGAARADSISLAAGSSITGNAGYNTRTGTGTVGGTVTTPLALPLPITIPALPSITPGSSNVSVSTGQTSSLVAGAYNTVTVGTSGTLNLTGGVYQLSSVTVNTSGRMQCQAACEVRVTQPVTLNGNAFFGPATGSTVPLSDVQLLVAATTSSPNATPGAVNLSTGASINAYVLARNGTIRLGSSCTVVGKLVARDVLFGTSATETGAVLPLIVTEPQDLNRNEHQQATFSVVASGTTLAYRWRKNGVDIPGATAATLTFEALAADNNAGYSVVVSNNAGSATSRTAVLHVATCAATDTTCNGIDDDCNGQIDEDYVNTSTTCGVGACQATGVRSCVAGSVTDSCHPGTPAASDASCDGIDQDCNGTADEDFVSAATSCGVGACLGSGVTSCVNGVTVNSCAPGTPAASDASCDGIDQDCSGTADEDFVSAATSCGVGACLRSGATSCVNGVTVNSCAPGTPAASDVSCDGVDQDCNGTADEDYVAVATSCGIGACAATGLTSCVSGSVQNSCQPGTAAADDATCNGVDDDCNGQNDEDYVELQTSCGVGACARSGHLRCANAAVTDDCAPGTAAANDAICNGVDDDCDGITDEDYVPEPASCEPGSCSTSGTTACLDGEIVESCSTGGGSETDDICNGIDDDCDGSVDDDYEPSQVTCGVGACARTASITCENGALVNHCSPGQAAANDASCDGIDDDCDGVVDEDFAGIPTSCGVGACASSGTTRCMGGAIVNDCTPGTAATNDSSCNGVDDDCDGSADEDYVTTATACGVGACTSSGHLRCVSGAPVDDCAAGAAPSPNDASCDGIDSDCNGQTDEDYAPRTTQCGVGACSASGTTACAAGTETNSCAPGTALANDASCNGADDDCDGQTDEDYVPTAISCGAGACARSGNTRCEQGAVVSDCTPGAPGPSDASCDGIDQDCDGAVNEDFAGESTSCGVGACHADGATRCEAGAVVDGCAPGIPAPSDASCNGIDDDCNGQPDDGYAAAATSCGIGACHAVGSKTCSSGHEVDSCAPSTPAPNDASCNGIDDDCDGTPDEDFTSQPVTCGVGACQASGSSTCANGAVTSSCTPGTPTGNDSDCDGIDDDCDGIDDEAFVVSCAGTSVQRCTSGAIQTSACSDENLCTGQESCSAGACVSGTPPDSSDDNPCTSDTCDPLLGVAHAPLSLGASCGPSRACDGEGHCIVPPVITQQPQSVSVSPGQPFTFSVAATGFGLMFQWKRFGQVIPGATSATYAAPAATLGENGVEYNVVVQNIAGSVTSSPAQVTVIDSGGPSLTVDGAAERTVDSDLITLTGSATDPASGVASVVIRSDRFPEPVAAVLSAGTGLFSAEVPLFVGPNALTVIATDVSSNETRRNVVVTLAVDALPRVTITEPTSGSSTADELVRVRGIVRSSLPPEDIRLVLGSEVSFPTGSGGEYAFEFENVRLLAGPNVLIVRAETSGGTATAQTVVTFARAGETGGAAPVVRVTGAQSEQFVTTSTTLVKGTVTAQDAVTSVSVNGQAATLIGVGSEISFETTLALPPGDAPLSVAIEARDSANRLGTLTYTLLHDDVAPVISTSLTPDDLHAVSVTPYTVQGSINERYLAGVSANNQSISVLPGAPGTWDFSMVVPLVRGENEPVVIEAWDRAGNRSSRRILLRFDGNFGVEVIAPVRGAELIAVDPTLDIDVVARVQGIGPDQAVTASVDGGAPIVLAGAGSTFTGHVNVSGATGVHELGVEVRAAGGQVLEQSVISFKIKAASEIPLTAVLSDPLNGAANVEANQIVLIELSRPVNPSELVVSLRETVHGKAYRELASGSNTADYTRVELVDVNRDDAEVSGGISYLPGDRALAFYPARDFGYGGNVSVRVTHNGSELLRSSFGVRPLPTLISGFIADQFFNPIEGMEVSLEGSSVSAFTNREGAFSFGFGKFADTIPGGRHFLVVNPGMKNPAYGTIQQWVYTQEGRAKDLGVVRAPLLSPEEPFRHISSESGQASLLNGGLVFDLSQASLTFPDGRPEGDVHAELFAGPSFGYRIRAVSVPFITYAVQPMGVEVTGPVTVDLGLPEESGNAPYLDALPELVLLSGLDPAAFEIVPIGVGRVDKEARRVRSEGELALQRLDFLALSPLTSAAAQKLLADYAEGTVTLPVLVAGLEALR